MLTTSSLQAPAGPMPQYRGDNKRALVTEYFKMLHRAAREAAGENHSLDACSIECYDESGKRRLRISLDDAPILILDGHFLDARFVLVAGGQEEVFAYDAHQRCAVRIQAVLLAYRG